MCGIVGVVGKINAREENAFKILLQLDTVRGPDSTGIVSISTKSLGWEYFKNVGTPWELFQQNGWGKFWARRHYGLIGHNRWATSGAVSTANSHPFARGKVVGVHNGTLRNRACLDDWKKFEVDSENIMDSLDKIGVEETAKRLQGAFSLAWYNNDTNVVHLLRNEERPMFMCTSEDQTTVFFASEDWMLNVALGRVGIVHTVPVQTGVGSLVSMKIKFDHNDHKEPLKPSIRHLELYKVPPYDYGVRYVKCTDGVYRDPRTLKGGNSVVPFAPRHGGDNLAAYVRKRVVFSVIGPRNFKGVDYILAEVDDGAAAEVHIFCTKNSKLCKLLMTSPSAFEGVVKNYMDKEGCGKYLTIDHRTIQEYTDPDDLLAEQGEDIPFDKDVAEESPDEVMGYRGKMVTAEEWYDQTSRGCSWCTDFPVIREAEELRWFGEGEFLCPSCAAKPEVANIIN